MTSGPGAPGLRPARIARLLARARIVLYVGLVGFVLYFQWRYDLTRLPPGGVSPLTDIQPGHRLVVDMHFRAPEPGAAVLYRGRGERLLLGRVSDPPESLAPEEAARCRDDARWIVKEVAEAAGEDSMLLGPISLERIVGRVVIVLPF
ncbi:MAG TPA: hypothetical protein ENJ09_09750 [Planctomycetes bacterium]|nr:hypothetical protein [Planctomycetota bacterium]